MSLNSTEHRVVQAMLSDIPNLSFSQEELAQTLNLSPDLVHYHLQVLSEAGYVKCFAKINNIFGELEYSACILTPSGRAAAQYPGEVQGTSSFGTVNTNIFSGSINAPIGIFQSSPGSSFESTQNFNTEIADAISKIDSIYQSVEVLPENDRDASKSYLELLKEEVEQPQRRDPKKVKSLLVALVIVLSASWALLTQSADFANNVIDLGQKFDVDVPKLIEQHQGR